MTFGCTSISSRILPRQVAYLIHWVFALFTLRTKNIQTDNAGTIMIFLKHFDTTRQSLYGIGKIHMPRASKVTDLIPIVNERMRWASATPLKLYEVTIGVFSSTCRVHFYDFPRKLNLA